MITLIISVNNIIYLPISVNKMFVFFTLSQKCEDYNDSLLVKQDKDIKCSHKRIHVQFISFLLYMLVVFMYTLL